MVRHIEDELNDSSEWWSLASSKIMPSLEDLHHAIRLRDVRKVKLLTSYSSIRIDSSLRSCTALSLAVYEGDYEIVRILLESGRANVNKLSCDWNGRLETPLFSACRLGHKEIAVLLIEYGADVNTVDFYMHSPLWIATRERSLDLLELLIANGACLNTVDKFSQCPLYLATKFLGRSEIAKSLIRHGCKLDLTDVDGRGAIYWTFVNQQMDVFRMLIYAGAHVNLKTREFLQQNRHVIDQSDIADKQLFNDWLNKALKNPPTLLQLAGRSVRNRLSVYANGNTIWPSVDTLNIPEKLKRLLKLRCEF